MLEKVIWTEADYDIMGWHDATVWALAFGWESHEFSLDGGAAHRWRPHWTGSVGRRAHPAPSMTYLSHVFQVGRRRSDLQTPGPGSCRDDRA
jgi:hypothetical protein